MQIGNVGHQVQQRKIFVVIFVSMTGIGALIDFLSTFLSLVFVATAHSPRGREVDLRHGRKVWIA